ncbi:hypothetical protein GCM10023183_26530 [Nibribacter koreensis]|uniref:Outer membrane protein beta-barrel domain-containing protein n=2 Tax=Nibribacter koreensis TaxID=1084519 RepID=A0ABP8FRD6_9BACT
MIIISPIAGSDAMAQKSSWQIDNFRIGTGATYGFQSGTLKEIRASENSPGVYETQESTLKLGNLLINAEAVFPFYMTPSWSVGAKAGASIGLQMVREQTDDFNGGVIYDFPQFLYYRNYQTWLDFTVLAGYKYTNAPLATHFAVSGVEVQVTDRISARLYGSLNNYKNQIYRNGGEEATVTLREFGFTLISTL